MKYISSLLTESLEGKDSPGAASSNTLNVAWLRRRRQK